MAINWTEDYATRDETIDRQHQKLFQYVNKLGDILISNSFKEEDINDLLKFLGDYTKMHFSHEEFCMNQKKCPSADKNKKAHDEFLTFFNNFIKDYQGSKTDTEKIGLLQKLHEAAEKWLINHICKIDILLRTVLK